MKRITILAVAAVVAAAGCAAVRLHGAASAASDGRDELAPPFALAVARGGVYAARLRTEAGPADGFAIVEPDALVRAWTEGGMEPLPVRVGARRCGVAISLASTNGWLFAALRLDRTGAEAFAKGLRFAEPEIEAERGGLGSPSGPPAPCLRAVRVAGFELRREPGRFAR